MVATHHSNPVPRWIWIAVLFLGLAKLILHFFASSQYGFHRDELLHIASGDHLAWGYFEFPPFIAWMAALQRTLFGDSVLAIRILPALAGTAMVLLTPAFVRALGGASPGAQPGAPGARMSPW